MKSEIVQILKRPFAQELIKHREGHDGKQLDYVPVQHYVDSCTRHSTTTGHSN